LQDNDEVGFKAVNACIQFLPTLDGKALVSVEDLRQVDRSLHPVQEAIVECHGSQCGFCTPGLVMSLWALYQQHTPGGEPPSRQAVCDALTGNLCRCTGYRPIIDAGQRMMALPAPRPGTLDPKAMAEALQSIQHPGTFHYSVEGQHFYAPRSLEAFATLKAKEPGIRILASGAANLLYRFWLETCDDALPAAAVNVRAAGAGTTVATPYGEHGRKRHTEPPPLELHSIEVAAAAQPLVGLSYQILMYTMCMPKRLAISPHLSLDALERRYRTAREPIGRTHWQIIWLLARGHPSEQVAAVAGYTVNWVRRLAQRYNRHGPAGLGDRRQRNPGRTGLLSMAPREALVAALAPPPPDGGVWTGPKAAAWMTATLGRHVHPQRGWEMLRRLGWTSQVPRPRHAKAEPAAQVAFKKTFRAQRRLCTTLIRRRGSSCGRRINIASGSRPFYAASGARGASARGRRCSTATSGAISMPSCIRPPGGRCGWCSRPCLWPRSP
jgi:transposase